MTGNIDDILNGIEPSVDEQPIEAAPEAVETEAPVEAAPETAERPRGPDGKFVSKGETEGASPAPQEEASEYEGKATIGERRRRQEAEARIAALEAQLQQFHAPQAQAQTQQPAPEFWDDPQSFMDQRFSQMTEQLFQQWEQRQQVQRIDASEQAAKARYADYDDAYGAFAQAVQLNPRLAIELAQAPDPGEFAYKRGKTALEIQRVGSVDQLRAEIRAELEAEARASIAPQRLVLPSTTAADGSVGGRSGPDWAGPKPLGQLLG